MSGMDRLIEEYVLPNAELEVYAYGGGQGPMAVMARELLAHRRASQTAPAPHYGWIFLNPDTGIEWSEQHPVESGEAVDAENVRPATLAELKAQMVSAWSDLMDREASDDRAPAPSDGLREALDRVERAMVAAGWNGALVDLMTIRAALYASPAQEGGE